MLYYLIHQSPLWSGMNNGKRNTRILFIVVVLYFLLYAISFENKDRSIVFKWINGFFIHIMLADLLLCGVVYRLYYGRSLHCELREHERDYYDEKTHTYYNAPPGTEENEKDNKNDNLHELNKPNKKEEFVITNYSNFYNDKSLIIGNHRDPDKPVIYEQKVLREDQAQVDLKEKSKNRYEERKLLLDDKTQPAIEVQPGVGR